MSDSGDARIWLQYAKENLQLAEVSLQNQLFNGCLQNAHQTIEKALKTVILSHAKSVQRTHSIGELAKTLRSMGIQSGLSDEDCELIDSVYLPSKYPPDSAMAYSNPDEAVSEQCISIARRTLLAVERLIG